MCTTVDSQISARVERYLNGEVQANLPASPGRGDRESGWTGQPSPVWRQMSPVRVWTGGQYELLEWDEMGPSSRLGNREDGRPSFTTYCHKGAGKWCEKCCETCGRHFYKVKCIRLNCGISDHNCCFSSHRCTGLPARRREEALEEARFSGAEELNISQLVEEEATFSGAEEKPTAPVGAEELNISQLFEEEATFSGAEEKPTPPAGAKEDDREEVDPPTASSWTGGAGGITAPRPAATNFRSANISNKIQNGQLHEGFHPGEVETSLEESPDTVAWTPDGGPVYSVYQLRLEEERLRIFHKNLAMNLLHQEAVREAKFQEAKRVLMIREAEVDLKHKEAMLGLEYK